MDHSDVFSDPERLPVTDEILSRYLAGAVSPTERLLVEQRLNEDPKLAAFVERLRESQRALDRSLTSNLGRGRELLASRVGFVPQHLSVHPAQAPEQGVCSPNVAESTAAPQAVSASRSNAADRLTLPSRKYVPNSPRFLRAVLLGGLAVTLGLGFVLNGYRFWGSKKLTSPVRTYATSIGQRASVSLSDGSTVMLAPQTHLRYSIDRAGIRTVDLVGEAFFRIRQGETQPFVVRTGHIVTRVLGTEFNVRHYALDRTTQVAVLTGRVASGGRTIPLVLAAGAVGNITDSSATLSLNDDPDAVTSWTHGNLIFHNAPVAAVLSAIGRWYGYEFRTTDTAITTGHMSAHFSADHANEALGLIKTVLGVTMTFEGNVITLRPERGEKRVLQEPRAPELSTHPDPEVGR